MKYKLKDHVTDEMLKAIGFQNIDEYYSHGAVGYSTFIDFETKEVIDTYDNDTLTLLFDLDYIEEVK